MTNMKKIMYLLLPALIFSTLFIVSCAPQGEWPAGLVDLKLAPCPESPNCVSSEGDSGPSHVEPLVFTGTPEVAWPSLSQAVKGIGGTIERETDEYMWATFKSKVFRFVDDMEFRLDATDQLIHVRSASRVGYSDLGVNRKRVEILRKKFIQEQERSGVSAP